MPGDEAISVVLKLNAEAAEDAWIAEKIFWRATGSRPRIKSEGKPGGMLRALRKCV